MEVSKGPFTYTERETMEVSKGPFTYTERDTKVVSSVHSHRPKRKVWRSVGSIHIGRKGYQ